jgi:hypothetical protein
MARLCTAQSCSLFAPTSVRPQAARGNSPAPAWPIPNKERTEERKKEKLFSSHYAPCPSPALCHRLIVFWSYSPPDLSGAQEVQNRLGAPLVRKQVADLEAILPPSCLSLHLRPQSFLLRLPSRTVLEQVLPCLHLAWTPPALRSGTALGPLEKRVRYS